MTEANLDLGVVAGFGDEWSRFDQSALSASDLEKLFGEYFANFPWDDLPANAVGADIGCGSGRWTKIAAPKVGTIYCVDPSPAALSVARRNLQGLSCQFQNTGVADMALPPLDFAYCLGVLHHVPDTLEGLKSCTAPLKPGAPFLLYLYYDFENRPSWFRAVWAVADVVREALCRLPRPLLAIMTDLIALTVYLPLVVAAWLGRSIGLKVESWPLSYYLDKPLYVMRNDSRDRFGTRVEKRFSRSHIAALMEAAGLRDITFNDHAPYWVALGRKHQD